MKRVSATALATFDIFQNVDIQERERIAGLMVLRTYSPAECLIATANTQSDVFFLLSGVVRANVNSQDGKQVQYEDLRPGMMFGELSAIDGEPRSNDCIALESCTVAVLSSASFYQVMQDYPPVMRAVLVRLSSLVRKHIQRVYEFSTESVGNRVRLEILRMIRDDSRNKDCCSLRFETVPTHADIASRISTHREAVTRELKSLEKMGLIDWSPGNYVVHDITAFENFALRD